MIEAAIVTPLFLMLVFGIFEVSLAMNNHMAVGNAVKSGARSASVFGDNAFSDHRVVQKVLSESTALNHDRIHYIVIYRPTGHGAVPSAGCRAGIASSATGAECNVYTAADWNRPVEEWGCSQHNSPDRHWCPSTRKVSLDGAGTDHVGVWMMAEHRWVTKLFGNDMTITDQSTIRLEPRRTTEDAS